MTIPFPTRRTDVGLVLGSLMFLAATAIAQVTRSASDPIAPTIVPSNYTLTPIDFPGAAGGSPAFGINDHDDVVGSYRVVFTEPQHGFLLSEGEFTTVEPSGSIRSQLFGINKKGDIVGFYRPATPPRHGFLLSRQRDSEDENSGHDGPDQGVFKIIDYPGAAVSDPTAINASRRIVGFFQVQDFNDVAHGFLLEHGQFKQLDHPGAIDTVPLGINARGDIVGNWDTLDDFVNGTFGHGFVLSHNKYIDVDFPGAAAGTSVNGINNRGQIVGQYIDNNSVSHGFVATGATFMTVDYPGAVWTVIAGINGHGVVVGYYFTSAGPEAHGFLGKPADEGN